MRPELVILALVCGVSSADAEVRGLVAADSYVASVPGDATAAADVAWSAHVDWREPDQSAVFDWVERESLVGGIPRRELHELAYVNRSFDHLELTVGRFRVPGGFWLIADGGSIAGRWRTFDVAVFAGSRSFTNARTETLLTSAPHPLPLAGVAMTTHGGIQSALSYTYTADRVVLPRGDGLSVTMTEPEQFVDGQLLAPIGEHVLITGGATVGSRYLVAYPTAASRVADDPSLENVWFGSQSVYGLVDWRAGSWRLDGSVAALRTKLGQATDDRALASITGSFVESTLRATWRRDREWRVDSRYRARVWADRRHAHRAQVAMTWRHGVLDVQARIGLDLHRGATAMSGLTNNAALVYRASIGRKTERSELAIGAAAVAALGDEVSAGPDEDTADQRAPYTLEARSYGFVRAFATRGSWFGGLDGEVNMRGDGVRALFQIGCSR